jgi:hypothetical protein
LGVEVIFQFSLPTNAQTIRHRPELFHDGMVYVGCCCGKQERRLQIQIASKIVVGIFYNQLR